MPDAVSLDKSPQGAYLEIRLLPWRPRPRRWGKRGRGMDGVDLALGAADDLAGLVIGVVIAILVYGLLPSLVLVLAAVLLPIELLVVIFLGLALVIVRFAGIVPWTVVLTKRDGSATIEHYRNLVTAIRRVRAVNAEARVPLRISLT